MNGKQPKNISREDVLQAQKALGGEKIAKQLADKEQTRKLEIEQARTKKIQAAKEKRATLRKEKLAKEHASWQKKVSANKAPKSAPKAAAPKITSFGTQSSALRTFQDDVAKTVRTQKESVTTIALAEQKKRTAQKEPGAQSELAKATYRAYPLKKFLVSFGILFVIVSLFGTVSSFLEKIQPKAPGTTISAEDLAYFAPIEIGEQEAIAIDLNTIPETVLDHANDVITPLTFKDLVFLDPVTEFRINTTQFISSWADTIPRLLERTLGDAFFVGIYAPISSKNEISLIFNVKSPEQALAGMLAWEETLSQDLVSLYVQTTLLGEVFQDTVFRNTDTRVLRDEEGRVRVGYSIIDNVLIISTGSASLNAAIEAAPSF